MTNKIKPLPVEYVQLPKVVFILLVDAIIRLAEATARRGTYIDSGLQYDLDLLRQAVADLTMPHKP